MNRKYTIPAIACFCCFAAGYAMAQGRQFNADSLETEINDVDLELRGYGDAKPDTIGPRGAAVARAAAGNADLTDAAIKQAYNAARTNRGQFNELKLSALQVAQNQRIIELLEQIAAQKKEE